MALTRYDELLETGPPSANPVTPEEEAANFKWYDELSSARNEAAAERAKNEVTLEAPAKVDATSLTNNEDVNKTFAGFQGLGLLQNAILPKAAKVIPPDAIAGPPTPIASAKAVEPDPSRAALIEANLAGFDPPAQQKLLGAFKSALDEGLSPQDAYRRFLVWRQDSMSGEGETGWPEYPNGAPSDKFWESYLTGLDEPNKVALRDQYNRFRTDGVPAYSAEEIQGNDPVSQVKANLFKNGLAGKGPLDPFEALVAVKEYEKGRYGAAGRPAAALTFETLMLNGALALPFTPAIGAGLVRFGSALAVATATQGAAGAAEQLNLPPEVTTAIQFGLYGIGSRGSLATRLREGLVTGAAAGLGEAATGAAGLPPVIGAYVGPVLSPGMAGIARRHFGSLLESAGKEGVDQGKLRASIEHLAVNFTRDDVGATVAIGDNIGIVDDLVGQDLLKVSLDNGIQVTVRRADVLHLPEVNRTTVPTMANPHLEDADVPMVLTEAGIASFPSGKTYIHFTPSIENAQSILREGVRPSPAATDRMPGVYVTEAPELQYKKAFGPEAVFLEGSQGRIATLQEVDTVAKELGIGRTPADQTKLRAELERRGFVGAYGSEAYHSIGAPQATREVVLFNEDSLKPRLSVSAGKTSGPWGPDWDTFANFAKPLMEGKIRPIMLADVAGGTHITGLSTEANMMISQVSRSALDRRMLAVALRKGNRPKTLPNTPWGGAYLFAKSAIGMAPGIKRLTQPMVLAAANYAEADQMVLTSRMATLQKATGEAFSKAVLDDPEGHHFLSQYKGPALKGSAGDHVVGTLTHVIDQPKLYDLSPVQAQVIDWWQTVLKADRETTKLAGVEFDLIEREYIPYKRKDVPQTWTEQLLAPKATAQNFGSNAGTGFRKQRFNQSLTDWATFIASQGGEVELDPFKLYLGRLQGTAKLRADQVFLRSSIAAYGKPIDHPALQVAMKKQMDSMKRSIGGRLTTAIRQETRASAQGGEFGRLGNLLTAVEKELDSVNASLYKADPTKDPFVRLSGALGALNKEANRVAGRALSSQERMQSTLGRLVRTKSEIAVLKSQVRNLAANFKMRQRAAPPPGWVEVGQGKNLGRRYAVPQDVAFEMRLVQEPHPIGDVTAAAKKGLDTLRTVLLSADGSFLSQQGYALGITNPTKFLGDFAHSVNVSMTEEGFNMFVAANLESFTQYAQAGGTLYTRATDVVKGAASKALAEKLPLIHQLNAFGYDRLLPIHKMRQFQTLVQMLENVQNDKTLLQQVFSVTPFVGPKANEMLRKFAGVENKSHAQLMEAAADTVNNIGGGINYAKLGAHPTFLSQSIFLTEGWLRANVGRIVSTAKVGDPAGVLARRWMLQNLLISAALSTAFSLAASGRLPNYDPLAPDFLDIQAGDPDSLEGGSIPFLPGKTYIRAIFQGIAGVPWDTEDGEVEQRVGSLFRFGAGRTGQLPRLGVDLITGKDYFGRHIDNQLLHAGRSLLPVSIQNTVEALQEGQNMRQTAITSAVGAFGLNWVPRNPYDARDASVAEQGFVDLVSKQPLLHYGDLTDSQRADFDKTKPEYTFSVTQWQEERDSPFAALRANRDEQRAAVVALGKALQGTQLSEQERALLGSPDADITQVLNNPRLYRQWLGSIGDQYRQKADKIGVATRDFEPVTASQAVVAGYYTEVIDKSKVAGGLDYVLMDANERTYRAQVEDQYGQAGLDVLDAELLYRTTDDPVAQAYHRDQQLWNPYFNYLDGFWSADNLVSAGFSPAEAADAAQLPTKERYQTFLSESYFEQLVGQPLSTNLYNFHSSSSGDSLGKKWGIVPGQRLTEQQAQDIAEELVRVKLKTYSDRIVLASDAYFKENTDSFCAATWWGIVEPTVGTRPYLGLCGETGRVTAP
jgi:hypothetical protein